MTDRSATTIACQKGSFSLPAGLHYLNCAFMAPLSDAVVAAGEGALQRAQVPSRINPQDFFDESHAVRRLFARLIHATDANRIAIIPSVSYAMATVARNTPLRRGQNVVVVHEQFPSNVYTWRRLCRSAETELRTVSPPGDPVDRGETWNAAVIDAIDEYTGLVAIPELHWTDGTRFNLEAIGMRARECGAAFVVDGTQSVGATPFDVREVQPDALVCAGYKWLMGPYAAGLAYFGPSYDEGTPIEENWITRLGSEDFAGLIRYRDDYQPGALRYDVGERSNFILLPMLEAALTQVLDWGPSRIQAYCQTLTANAVSELRESGCWIEQDTWRRSHLFGVRMPSLVDVGNLSTELAVRQVSVSVRGSAVRVAPHLYNDIDDLAALVTAVRHVTTRSSTA